MRRTRDELLRLLEPGLGREAANALVEEFEKVDPDRLATRDDLVATGTELGHRIDLLRTEMEGRFRHVDERFARVDDHFDAISGEIAAARDQVLAAVRGEMIDAIATQTRTMQYTLAGMMAAVIAFAASLATFL